MTLDLSSFECKTNFHGATECAILFEVLIGSASDIQYIQFNVKVLLSFSFRFPFSVFLFLLIDVKQLLFGVEFTCFEK